MLVQRRPVQVGSSLSADRVHPDVQLRIYRDARIRPSSISGVVGASSSYNRSSGKRSETSPARRALRKALDTGHHGFTRRKAVSKLLRLFRQRLRAAHHFSRSAHRVSAASAARLLPCFGAFGSATSLISGIGSMIPSSSHACSPRKTCWATLYIAPSFLP